MKSVQDVIAHYSAQKRPDVRLAILEGAEAGRNAVRFRDLPDLAGCGDNSCIVRTKRGGMATNGGCRCDARELRRAVQALRLALDKLQAELTETEARALGLGAR